ncbi:MAG: hypothetical protein QNK36_03970 [Colwellia sp.]|nr:hypothetical protein [Colwellia sp.]
MLRFTMLFISLLVLAEVRAEPSQATEHLELYRLQLEQLKTQFRYSEQLSSEKLFSINQKVAAIETELREHNLNFKSNIDKIKVDLGSKLDIAFKINESKIVKAEAKLDKGLIKAESLKGFSESIKDIISWWMTLIGIILAVSSVIIPLFVTFRQKSEINNKLKEVEGHLSTIETCRTNIETHVADIKENHTIANKSTESIKEQEIVAREHVQRIQDSSKFNFPSTHSNKLSPKLTASKSQNTSDKGIESLASFAYSRYLEDDYKTAVILYTELTNKHSENSTYWANLASSLSGISFSKFQDDSLILKQSIKAFYTSLTLEDNISTLISLAGVYVRLAKISNELERDSSFEQAIKLLERSKNIENENIEVHLGLGFTYENLALFKPHKERILFFEKAKSCYEMGIELNDESAEAHRSLGNLFMEYARLQIDIDNDSYHEKAILQYKKIIKINPQDSRAYLFLGDLYQEYARSIDANKRQTLFNEAKNQYSKYIELEKEDGAILSSLGVLTVSMAEISPPEKRELLFNEALNLFEKSLNDSKDDLHKAFIHGNIGDTLLEISSFKLEQEQKIFFRKAIIHFEKAISIDKSYFFVLADIANAYTLIANLKPSKERQESYYKSVTYYHEAIERDLGNQDAYFYTELAETYLELFKIVSPNEKQALLDKANEQLEIAESCAENCCELAHIYNCKADAIQDNKDEQKRVLESSISFSLEAILFNENDIDTLEELGKAYIHLGKITLVQPNDYYAKAMDTLLKIESLDKGTSSYELACLYSLLEDFDKVDYFLLQAKKYGIIPSKEKIKENDELENIRGFTWYQSFLNSL